MRDKDGFLPAHIACSHEESGRYFPPKKLEVLLGVNPDALFAKTSDERTLLTLAKGTETASQPNYELLRYIETRMNIYSKAPSPMAQVGHYSFDSSKDDLAKGNTGIDINITSDLDNVKTANLLLHLAGRLQNTAS